MQRTLDISRSAGVRMLLVHAIGYDAVAFYLRYGSHVSQPAAARFLPIETITDAL